MQGVHNGIPFKLRRPTLRELWTAKQWVPEKFIRSVEKTYAPPADFIEFLKSEGSVEMLQPTWKQLWYMWVLERSDTGEVVGFGILEPSTRNYWKEVPVFEPAPDVKEHQSHIEIKMIAIIPQFVGTGFGSILFQFLVKRADEIARKKGYNNYILRLDSGKFDQSVKFYERHGFGRIGKLSYSPIFWLYPMTIERKLT